MFDIVDRSNNYNGYIVIGAQEEYAPIIEFSISKEDSFFENAVNDDKVYYLGGLEYYSQDSSEKKICNIQSNVRMSGTVETILETVPVVASKKTNYITQWEEILNEIEDQEQQINSRGIIINPENYENGYNSCSIRTMPWAASAPYVTTSDYSQEYYNHCGPVAITNLMILGYNSYDLDLKNGTWDSVFEQICELAGVTGGNGELYSNQVRDTAKNYAKARGYSRSSASLENSKISNMKGYIEDDVLTILQVENHDTYKDHYVVPYGYEEYKYNNYANVYFAIADGWSSNTRYVLYDDASFVYSVVVNIA